MYKHILIPTDGSPLAGKAVDAGIDYARETGAKITLFVAVPEYQPPGQSAVMAHRPIISLAEHERLSAERANMLLAPALEKARWAGADVNTDHALSDRPADAIIEAARRNGCDAIFMSSHGRRGLAALVRGSQTVDVLTHSDIPTVVYR
jgi:nucleotide-binding universal stress UspA family protein